MALALIAFLQPTPSAGDAAAGLACCGSFVFVGIGLLALNIAILVWVARDAKARGMDSPILWMLLVFFTSIVGLVIYLLVRPKGDLIKCPNCGNRRLAALPACPHCGNGPAKA